MRVEPFGKAADHVVDLATPDDSSALSIARLPCPPQMIGRGLSVMLVKECL